MRDLLLIGVISVVAILIGTTLYFLGPSSLRSDISSAVQSAQTGDTPAVHFTILEQGPRAISITDRTNYRIQSVDDFAALWPMIYGNAGSPAMPTVDFSKYEVLALFDGSHSTTGYLIAVKGVSDKNATRTVTVEHSAPASTCRVTTAAASPFILIEVPKTVYALAHIDVIGANPCGN